MIVKPLFTPELLVKLDENKQNFQDLHGKSFLPGYVGLNNIKANDYINVIVQLLAHVPALRDYFLLSEQSGPLTAAWRDLLQKIWNPSRFKAQSSPHEFIQLVSSQSKKRFSLTEQADPFDFMAWLINSMSQETDRLKASFQGRVKIESFELNANSTSASAPKLQVSPFFFLTLDLPPKPLFQDPKNPTAVPQVPLANLLEKFNGGAITYKQARAFIYTIPEYPPFLLLHVNRFVKTGFSVEHNPTIVNFSADEVIEMPADPNSMADGPKYRLMANVYCRREGEEGKAFGIHVRCPAVPSGWLEMENLSVREAEGPLLFMSETYIQLYQRL